MTAVQSTKCQRCNNITRSSSGLCWLHEGGSGGSNPAPVHHALMSLPTDGLLVDTSEGTAQQISEARARLQDLWSPTGFQSDDVAELLEALPNMDDDEVIALFCEETGQLTLDGALRFMSMMDAAGDRASEGVSLSHRETLGSHEVERAVGMSGSPVIIKDLRGKMVGEGHLLGSDGDSILVNIPAMVEDMHDSAVRIPKDSGYMLEVQWL